MRFWHRVLVAALLVAVPAGASERVKPKSNCGSGNEVGVGVIPTPETGDFATFVASWNKSNVQVIGELVCLLEDDLFTFGAWTSVTDGGLQISGGTFGEVCGLFLCTLGGSDKVFVSAFFGAPDPTLGTLSAGDDPPVRRLFPVEISDFPGASERLGELADSVRRVRGRR
ncbi:MAG: hypothetical protein R3325_14900 [Thermoanaerobaculia bacterium]|nr:hypothetical protein [Thermoanaerobaculia bacterium]